MIRPWAWWTLYYGVAEFARGQSDAEAMADRLYAVLIEGDFLKAKAKKLK